MMRRMLVLGVVLSLCLPFAIAADDPGVNRTIDVEGTPIESITVPNVSTDGVDFVINVTLTTDAAENGTTVEWTVQQCINSGVCNPPEKLAMTGSDGNWSGTITPVDTHSYINYDVILTYPSGDDEKFPEDGFPRVERFGPTVGFQEKIVVGTIVLKCLCCPKRGSLLQP